MSKIREHAFVDGRVPLTILVNPSARSFSAVLLLWELNLMIYLTTSDTQQETKNMEGVEAKERNARQPVYDNIAPETFNAQSLVMMTTWMSFLSHKG